MANVSHIVTDKIHFTQLTTFTDSKILSFQLLVVFKQKRRYDVHVVDTRMVREMLANQLNLHIDETRSSGAAKTSPALTLSA